MNARLRRIWLTIHRWLGLTVGLLFVLLGLSGSVLVFHRGIDEWLNPDMLLAGESGPRQSLQDIIDAAEATFSGRPERAQFVDSPRTADGVWTVWFPNGTPESSGSTQVYIDPDTAEVTGRRVWGEYPMTWIYRLHYRLLAGETGETIVGIAGIVLMVSIGTGIFLWWPLWQNSWRAAFALRRGNRFQFDLHKTGGIASAVILPVIAFTGVYMIFPEWIRPCVTMLSAETVPNAEHLRSTPHPGAVRIDADQAVAIARSVYPDAELKRLYLPSRPDGVYVARVRRPGEVRRSSGNTRVWIEQYSGEVLAVRDWNRRTAADAFFAWQFPLHNGEAFGLAGRWIVFMTGLAPAVLYVTGVMLWLRRRRSRRRQLSRVLGRHDGVTRNLSGEAAAAAPVIFGNGNERRADK